eukprot:CAMPEP_0201524192 /NCGR_PEP_ID=MMETSP0161_2-20130828/21168_1 /ASSEMBLY_ACC=CAM_ASM_000251 /TAXON_ID=180227 /ORGANISM="Neoparamoeba aestuarina, Strain SoJaBio B1-5/56/2" /LENGTH=301 /DNA_ID=CAMNT_0047923485 /DNA_START=88 /DNA_END=993 /DNA_ORIENTATION=-
MDPSVDRDNQQIDPEKMLKRNEVDSSLSSDDDGVPLPSTQPLPRRGFLGGSSDHGFLGNSSPDSDSPISPLSTLSSSDISNDDSSYLSRSYGNPHPGGFKSNTNLSPRKEIAERNKTKLKKKRVMSTTTAFNSPTMSAPGSPFESPMITSITKGVRLPPTQEEGAGDPLRRDQQIDPEKQMMRRDHPIDDDEDIPQAPSTGPLPRRAIPGGPAGGLKPKALFLDDGYSEEEGGELTFQKEKVASTGSIDQASLEEREKRLTMLEQTLASELEELRLFKQRLLEKEQELNEREKRLSASSPQ